MNDFPILNQTPSAEDLYLVGFRLDPDSEGPQFYTLFAFGGDNERPITTVGDRVVFFTRPELSQRALEIGDPSMQALGEVPEDLDMLCDIAQTMYLINAESEDSDKIIVDCLEVVDDLVRATRLSMPPLYQEALSDLMAHLQRTHMYGEFLRDEGSRERLEDALLWCVGAITMKSTMLSE
ncbi:hypothetical protein Acid345_1026 [Candidatus Koribacter versatilis Ellin345]|uniref:Uncharacterized protein n=1 Tax=Koribacter versatilis (strain Ellin345) TaxID=204669 RepID=Q1ISX1_KORVE|nr:hypothetical protein [Candidatus Koribacter versatilis]ABF40029.1 hypothetical protein Acid345_1026 [Candidatus Koribacter versatilis Ellin345]